MVILNLHNMQKEESVNSPLSVALGNFDGVHAGHTALILKAVEIAKEKGIASAVWTFADGKAVLPNKPGTLAITTLEERLSLIASLGVDYAILESFEDVRDYTPERFANELLKKKCKAVWTVCGFNFRFGAGGAGDSEKLRELMQPEGCTVVPPVYVNGEQVSSTLIRGYIEAGDMKAASELLGRQFFIDTTVTHGKALGRTIGIPTINQSFPEGHIVPKKGIYACIVHAEGEKYIGVANVGIRPTVDSDDIINCETHIIGYDGELYGKQVRVEFFSRIRDEKKFGSVSELKEQIEKDIIYTKEYFEKK